jgi:aminobenzoyl-glutamate utilization protein B
VDSLKEPPKQFMGGASSDVGDVSLIAPTATLRFPAGVPGMIGHHWSSVASYYGSAARKGANAGAKVIAATAIDLLTEPGTLQNIRNSFAKQAEKHPYESFLPEDAVPPLDVNKTLMEKWRPVMQKCYIE